MQVLGVLLAAAAAFGFGAAWYMALAKPWMAAVGKTEAEIEASKDRAPFVIAAVAAVLAGAMMRHLFVASGVGDLGACVVGGLGLGLFVTAPWIVLHYAFAGRPKSLWWIDAGHTVGAFGLIGLVLSFFL